MKKSDSARKPSSSRTARSRARQAGGIDWFRFTPVRDGISTVTIRINFRNSQGNINLAAYNAQGKLIGRHRSTGIARPRFWERAEYYGETERLSTSLAGSEVRDSMGNTLGETNA